jgi:hypothetical protein
VRWLERRRIETRTVKAMERGLAAMEAGRTEAPTSSASMVPGRHGVNVPVDVPLEMVSRGEVIAGRLGVSTDEVLTRALAIGAEKEP